jgi:uncharacterized membrane protein YoaK (UPF0700 family)
MQRYEPPLIAAAVLLAALAGFVDAMAFIELGGFFASFMSGNSTRLGVALGTRAWGDVMMAAALILSFVSGVILAAVIARARPAGYMALVMAAVTVLLALGALLGSVAPGPLALLLLAAAMGAENGVFNRGGEVSFGVTYMSGALVRMGQKLAGALMGDSDRWGWLPYLALWAGFVAGVVLGAGAQARMGWNALWFAALAAAALTVLVARVSKRGPVAV